MLKLAVFARYHQTARHAHLGHPEAHSTPQKKCASATPKRTEYNYLVILYVLDNVVSTKQGIYNDNELLTIRTRSLVCYHITQNPSSVIALQRNI